MRISTVWQKRLWSVLAATVFLVACTQAKNTPVAANGAAVMPTKPPLKASDEQMALATTQVLTQKLSTRELAGFSVEQVGDLLLTVSKANPQAKIDLDGMFGWVKDGSAPTTPSFDALNPTQAHNAQLLYDSTLSFMNRFIALESVMDQRLLTSKDVENLDGNLLYALMITYLEKHPMRMSAIEKVEKLPNETDQAYSDRQWDAAGPVVGKNLRLLNRYMDYYNERGWWRFSR